MSTSHLRLSLGNSSALLGVAVVAMAIANSAAAQDRTYNIPEESLTKALRDFGRVSGRQIIFTEDLVRGRTAAALNGEYSPETALARLLEGSGLKAQVSPSGTVMIVRPSGAGATSGEGSTRSPRDANQLGEVVVTANKRAERIQDVAMSISAIGGPELERSQALDLQDIANKVPGLSLEQGGLNYGTRIILRGQNSGSDGATVATLVDDFPISFSGALTDGGYLATDFEPYDVSRIEVLKGPQGTLYGATAEGGLVKYVTNPPDPRSFHGGLEAGVAGIAHGGAGASAKGYVNLPLLEGTAALRVSGYYEAIPGWINDHLLGEKDDNGNTRYGVRASFLWKPTQDLTIRATAYQQRLLQSGLDQVDITGAGTSWSLPTGLNLDTYIPNRANGRTAVYGITIKDDLHWALVESISSFGQVRAFGWYDNTSLYGLFSPNSVVRQRQLNGLEKVTQEFRISSEPGTKLLDHNIEWQTGIYFTQERVDFDQYYDGLSYPGLAYLKGTKGNLYGGQTPSQYQEGALYGDITYHFTPKFDIEAGGRVSANNDQSTVTEVGLLGGGATPTSFPRRTSNETVGTYSFAPRYHLTDDLLVYGRIASGYRPGGSLIPIAGAPPGLPTSFSSDSTVNYEVGLKGELFARSLSFDISAYYIDWSRIQVNQVFYVNVGGIVQNYNQTGNAGQAVSQGLEWTLNWTPIHGLNLGFVGAYTDAHLTQDAPGIGGVKGESLAYVPKISGNLNAEYDWRITDRLRGFVGGTWAYTGKRYTFLASYAPISHLPLPDYDTLALHGGIRHGPYTFEIYGKNITDARAVTEYLPQGGLNGGDLANIIRPRIIGARVSADF